MRIKFILLLCISFFAATGFAQEVNIVPYPKNVATKSGESFKLVDGYTIKSDKLFKPLVSIMLDDISTIYNIDGKAGSRGGITLAMDKTMAEESYKLNVTSDGVVVTAANYNSMVMGVTSMLQLIDKNSGEMKGVTINDAPEHSYRCYMLDVARQWTEMSTVKQIVDLCRWYKVRYMQMHLTDDQLFTFNSKKFPKLATPNKNYTIAELKDLVDYAAKRGVIIIPEFDLPGHSTVMRQAMPELFGKKEWGVIDLANPKAMEAVKVLAKEIMDTFSTSEYFHIGADEAWLGNYEKLDHVQEYVKAKGFDNAHDLYMQFIVDMHKFVTESGKKTIVWESFQDRGSRKVLIPNDMPVIAWETLYQSPQSLLKNGYKIINASWKPAYMTPGWRWSKEYIYNWNLRRWENHWNIAPSFQNPINIEDTDMLLGGQMCAWEMNDQGQYLAAFGRIAAFSENVWNDTRKRVLADFNRRFEDVDSKISTLVFPAKVEKSGFKSECKYGLDNNRINNFGEKGSITITPNDKTSFVTYTIDGSMPNASSPRLTKTLSLDRSMVVKFAIFNSNKKQIGYKSVDYIHAPIDAIFLGDMIEPINRNILARREIFRGKVDVLLQNGMPQSDIRYTTDGKTPTASSAIYDKPITLVESATIIAQCFVGGEKVGSEYKVVLTKADIENNITTNRPTILGKNIDGELIENNRAVDGIVDIDRYWGNGTSPESMIVDLEEVMAISTARLFPFWDGRRSYQYTIETSLDGKEWSVVVDRSKNSEIASPNGHIDTFSEVSARYVRVNMLKNSMNSAVHIVEIRLY